MSHDLSGNCPKCLEIMQTYPGFHEGLWTWFTEIQSHFPEAHVSCCGRGQVDQEAAFKWGKSRAHWGQSSHNYNLALDIFRLKNGVANYDKVWYNQVIMSAVCNHNASPDKTFSIEWYGMPHAAYYELPHCEVGGWKNLGFPLVTKE